MSIDKKDSPLIRPSPIEIAKLRKAKGSTSNSSLATEGKLINRQFYFDEQDLVELYELAPKYCKKKRLPVVGNRQAPFMIKQFLKEGIAMMKRELGLVQDEEGEKENENL